MLPLIWLLSMTVWAEAPPLQMTPSTSSASAKKFTPQEIILNSRRSYNIGAQFDSPTLPEDMVVDLTVLQPYKNWQADEVYALLVWENDTAGNAQNSLASEDYAEIPLIAMKSKQSEKFGEQTTLSLRIPPVPGNWALWNKATIHVVVTTKGKINFTFTDRVHISRKMPSALIAGLVVLLLYILAAIAYSRGLKNAQRRPFTLDPMKMTAGMYGRASISQFQVFLFSMLVAGMMIFAWLRTGVLLELSEDLLYLLGISALGAGASKYTSVVKRRPKTEVRSYLRAKGWLPPETEVNESGARWQNLLRTDGKLDIYKFQMALFSLVVATALLSAGIADLGVIEIPNTLLTLLGMSQTVYVGGKAISQTNVVEFEKNVKEMQVAEDAYLNADDEIERGKRFKTYAKEFEEARLLFEDIFGIAIPDDKALPKMVA